MLGRVMVKSIGCQISQKDVGSNPSASTSRYWRQVTYTL